MARRRHVGSARAREPQEESVRWGWVCHGLVGHLHSPGRCRHTFKGRDTAHRVCGSGPEARVLVMSSQTNLSPSAPSYPCVVVQPLGHGLCTYEKGMLALGP